MEAKKINFRFNTLVVILIVIICISISPVMLQNDTFYTIKIGEHIINNGITQPDPFTWHDITYTYPHWTYDVMIYLIYNIGGMMGIYISTIIFSAILGFAIYFTHNKITNNKIISFILTVATLLLLKNYIAARAQLITYILFTFTMLCIEMFIRTKKKRYGIGLVGISLIIANIHIAVWPFFFILFLPAIGEYLIVLMLETRFKTYIMILEKKLIKIKFLEKIAIFINKDKNYKNKLEESIPIEEEKNNKYKQKINETLSNPYKIHAKRETAIKWLILIMIICALMGLITPLKDAPYTYLIRTMQGNTTKNIAEHSPIVLIQSGPAMLMIIISLGLITFTNVKVKLRDLFLIGGLTILTLYANRQVSLLVLLGMFVVSRLASELVSIYDPDGTEKMLKLIVKKAGQVATIIIILLLCYTYGKDRYKEIVRDNKSHIVEEGKIAIKDSLFLNEKIYPVEASKFIKENLDVENIRLFNEYNYGSYLIYENIKVFIDSRADLYTKEFNGKIEVFSDFLGVSNLDKDYDKIFDKYDITHCIFQKAKIINKALAKDDNYKEIYADPYFIIYEKLDAGKITVEDGSNNESEIDNNEIY